jgi:hypothetical protein
MLLYVPQLCVDSQKYFYWEVLISVVGLTTSCSDCLVSWGDIQEQEESVGVLSEGGEWERVRNGMFGEVLVQVCNPSYLGGQGLEDHHSRPA